MGTARAELIRERERAWWRRLPVLAFHPQRELAALDDSDETAEALQEPMVAVTILAGMAMFLSTSTAGALFEDPEFDWMLVAVEAFFAGVLVAAQTYWLGGAALLIGLRSAGSAARYRAARHVVGLATVPFALALLVVWPVRLAVFGGDLFRSGGSDEGAAGVALSLLDAAFAAWALALLVVGVRTLERWSWARAAVAAAFTGVLFGLLVVAALYA